MIQTDDVLVYLDIKDVFHNVKVCECSRKKHVFERRHVHYRWWALPFEFYYVVLIYLYECLRPVVRCPRSLGFRQDVYVDDFMWTTSGVLICDDRDALHFGREINYKLLRTTHVLDCIGYTFNTIKPNKRVVIRSSETSSTTDIRRTVYRERITARFLAKVVKWVSVAWGVNLGKLLYVGVIVCWHLEARGTPFNLQQRHHRWTKMEVKLSRFV